MNNLHESMHTGHARFSKVWASPAGHSPLVTVNQLGYQALMETAIPAALGAAQAYGSQRSRVW